VSEQNRPFTPSLRQLWLTRLKLIFIGVPLMLLLIAVDAASAAWDELRADWRSGLGDFMDIWRNG
jgi:hypothetical protein